MALDLVTCPVCGGCGYFLVPDYSGGPFADPSAVKETCEGCMGHGCVPVEVSTCCECGRSFPGSVNICQECYENLATPGDVLYAELPGAVPQWVSVPV